MSDLPYHGPCFLCGPTAARPEYRTTPATETLTFPVEMCFAVGMALSDNAEGTVPSCLGGTWFPNGF
jgi:hypothetical protein